MTSKDKNKIIELLLAAVTFYADPETYYAITLLPDTLPGLFFYDFSKTKLGVKPGKLARSALIKANKICRLTTGTTNTKSTKKHIHHKTVQ